jgi:phospholipid/cholesterol/gamma-HCH transport system substrate-binding protein
MERIRGAWVGAFVIGGVLLFSVGLFLIGDRRLLFAEHFELRTTFAKVTGLKVGTRVRLAGLDVGEVLEIRVPARPSERFVVRMRVREDLRQLVRTDSVSAIHTDGIVGAAFVQVTPGTDEAPVVEPGAVISGRDPIEFTDLVEEGRDTFRVVSREIQGLTDDVSVVLASLTKTVDTTESVVARVGDQVEKIGDTGMRVTRDAERVVGDVGAIVSGVRAGEGSLGKLVTDTAFYDRLNAVGRDAAESARVMKETAETVRTAVRDFSEPGGIGPVLAQNIRNTLAGIEEVTSDLAEGTEALKRNFIFRGFFRSRGFFDLDAISREAYQAGLLERDQRTAVRIWLDASGLFARDADGVERMTEEGRRRIDSAMAQLVQYPRDSPLIVEGYAAASDEATSYLTSVDRGTAVRDYVMSRFRRQATLTDVMPLGNSAIGSPSGDGRWDGVALAMYVRNDVFRGARK